MKDHDIYAAIRIIVLLALVVFFAILCKEEKDMKEAAPVVSPAVVEQVEVPTETWTNLGVFELTAYCPCQRCCGYWATQRPMDEEGNPIVYTASGAVASEGTTIAVDTDVIPYGTTVKINGHTYIAQDTGGAIDGNRIDVYFADHQPALEFGRQSAEVYILEN